MSKPKNPRGRFVMLYQDLMESAAWASLSGNERALYVHVAARYNGKNNGRIPFSAREATLILKISKGTAARAFKNLIERGFIAVAKRSASTLSAARVTPPNTGSPNLPATSPANRRPTNSGIGGAEKTVPKIFHGLTRNPDRSHQETRPEADLDLD